MAENQNYIGVAMGLDVSDLKAGLSEANKQIQLANSKFKAAASGMDDWTKSAEGLSAKIEQLDTVLKMQQSKLAGLKAEYAKVAKEQGENSEAARRLQVQINNQQAVVNRTEKEYKNYKETLKGVKDGSIDLEKTSLKAGKAVEKAGKQAEEAGDGFTIAKGAIAGFIANGLTNLVSMGGNAIKTVLGLSEATREYRKTLATLDTAANDAGVNTDKMREKFTDLMGVFNDQDSVTEGLNNLMAAGFDEKNIDAITAELEGAALKFKDTLKFEGVSDGLQETLATGKAIGPFAELLERSGVNLEKFDEGLGKAKTSAEKQNYVLQELSKLGLADVSKNFREQNKEMIAAEKANVEYQNSIAELGKKAEPVMMKVREGFTRILEKVLELVGGADLDSLGEKIDGAFDVFVDEILPAIVDGLKWIIDNKDTLIAGVAGIGAAFLAWKVTSIIQGVVKAFKAWQLATEGMTVAQRLLNLVMKANPIGIVISLIAGLVTAFVLLWNKSDAFRNFFIGMWEGIKNAVGVVVEWIKENWKTMLLFLVNPVAGVFKYLYDNFEGFRNFVDNVVKSVKKFFSDMWSGMKKGAVDAWNGIKSVFSKVGSFFSDTFSRAWQKVKDIFSTGGKIFDGIKDGIVSAFKDIVNRLIRGINKVVSVPFNALNKVLDKIRDVEIAGFSPFKNLIKEISVPEIPELFRGGVLKKGQIGLLEGKGAEAVVPLEKNLGWIKKIAAHITKNLAGDVSSIKGGASSYAFGGVGGRKAGARGGANINAPLTVNYNGKLSRKEIKKTQNNHYKAIRMRLKAEGAI